MRPLNPLALSGFAAFLVLAGYGKLAAEKGDLSDFLGTWRGRSACVNRQAAPACTDEVVVYQVSRSDTPNAAVLEADKIVDGQRVPGRHRLFGAAKQADAHLKHAAALHLPYDAFSARAGQVGEQLACPVLRSYEPDRAGDENREEEEVQFRHRASGSIRVLGT